MMERADADDQIERPLHLRRLFNRQRTDVEIRQVVLALEFLRVLDARGTDVDADNVRIRMTEGVLGGLPGSATGDKNVQVCVVGPAGPQQVIFSATMIQVLPLITRAIEGVDRRWVGLTAVELGTRVILYHRPSHLTSRRRRRSTPSRSAVVLLSRAPGRC